MKWETLSLFVVFLFVFVNVYECRRSGGGGVRKSSSRVTTRRPSRTTTRRATTPTYNVQTQHAYPNYNQPSYNQPSYNQPSAARVTTPRYNIQTHQSYPNYNQPGYNQPHYNQPSYNQPHYNQPHYNQPGYNQPFPNNNYHPSGVWQPNKDHSVRNSVLAGLGGSALGLYLGYKLGGLSNSPGTSNTVNGPSGYPQYSVVHHYYHGDRPIPENAKVEPEVIKKCENITFCTPNTTPLCMTNGTVYCTASLESTIVCNENSTELKCINSTITLPCDANSTNCNSTSLNTTSISIPCLTTIEVFGDFGTNKFSVNKVSKRSADNETTTTTEETSSSTSSNTSDVNITSSTTTMGSSTSAISITPSSLLTSAGISNKYCVTVIADPIKEPEVPPLMSNEEFVKYVKSNQVVQNEVSQKWSEVFNSALAYVFF